MRPLCDAWMDLRLILRALVYGAWSLVIVAAVLVWVYGLCNLRRLRLLASRGWDSDTVAFAMRAEVRLGELTVSVHGTPTGYAPGATTADVAAAIRRQPVRAPTGPVHLDPGSFLPWLPSGTEWRWFG